MRPSSARKAADRGHLSSGVDTPTAYAPFDAVPPIWQLSVGDVRVFYDIDETDKVVYVRAIRRKPPGKTTKEIL